MHKIWWKHDNFITQRIALKRIKRKAPNFPGPCISHYLVASLSVDTKNLGFPVHAALLYDKIVKTRITDHHRLKINDMLYNITTIYEMSLYIRDLEFLFLPFGKKIW